MVCRSGAARASNGEPAVGSAVDSAYAPYVDAMFVDRQCHRLMRDTPLSGAIPGGLAVFSVENLNAFEDWLSGVEAAAPGGHFELLEQIYGPAWLGTYDRLLEPPGDG